MFSNQAVNVISGFLTAALPLTLYPVFIDTSNKNYLFILVGSFVAGLLLFVIHYFYYLKKTCDSLTERNNQLKANNNGLIERDGKRKKQIANLETNLQLSLNENTRLNRILTLLVQEIDDGKIKRVKEIIEMQDFVGGINNGSKRIQDSENNR